MKKWFKIIFWVLGSVWVLSLIGQLKPQATPAETARIEQQQQAALTEAEAAKPDAKRDLVIRTFTWQKGQVGSVAWHSFSIYNASTRHDYTTIPVRFLYYSDLGTEVSRIDQVVNKVVSRGQTVHLEKVETQFLHQHTYGADMQIIERNL